MLLFGDWYQLKPVNGTALYGYTLDAPSETSRQGMDLLWGDSKNAVRKCGDVQLLR